MADLAGAHFDFYLFRHHDTRMAQERAWGQTKMGKVITSHRQTPAHKIASRHPMQVGNTRRCIAKSQN